MVPPLRKIVRGVEVRGIAVDVDLVDELGSCGEQRPGALVGADSSMAEQIAQNHR